MESEQNDVNRRWLKAGIGCFASFVFVTISVWACCAQFLLALDGIAEPPPEFCTIEDEIYQSIVLNGREWVEIFRSRNQTELGSGVIIASMPSGRRYSAVVAWDSNYEEAAMIRIIVNTFRDTLQEYIYSPDKIIRQASGEFKYLDNGVYCFDYSRWSFDDR